MVVQMILSKLAPSDSMVANVENLINSSPFTNWELSASNQPIFPKTWADYNWHWHIIFP